MISVNVGKPRLAAFRGVTVNTGIFKRPVEGRVALAATNLSGDGQADLAVHGGVDKAVYAYPVEHYDFWRETLQRDDFEYGQFGENFTVRGILENEITIGDVFRVGSAVVEVSQPRSPCSKLGIRMKMPEFPKLFLRSLRSGFYLRVLEEGEVGAGDRFDRLRRDPVAITVREMNHLFHFERENVEAMRFAVRNQALSTDWRQPLLKRIDEADD